MEPLLRGRRFSSPEGVSMPVQDFKGSFKGDIGPYKARIGLYWQYFGL